MRFNKQNVQLVAFGRVRFYPRTVTGYIHIYYCIYEHHHPSANELPGLKQCQPFPHINCRVLNENAIETSSM